MENIHSDPMTDLISDLNTLTTIAQANVITSDVKALAVGESRPAAVLFLDIVNYSILSKKLSSEKLSMLIDRIFRIFELSVKAYGGYCDKVNGDAGLYVFPGHPAHPPAIEGALRAGLVILERASQLRFSLEPQGIDFNVRIGVAFGDVTRERVGGESQQFTVMGNTVNLAQRLEASADPATMQVEANIAESVGDLFSFESVGEKALKNIGVHAVLKVVKLNERIYQFRTSGAYLSKFVGRDKEFTKVTGIIDKWLKTSNSPDTFDVTKMTNRLEKRNRILIIRGAMAIGKSRLAYELMQYYIRKNKANTTTAHCLSNNMLDLFAAELIHVAGLTAENLPERWEELCAHAEKVISKEYADRQRRHITLLAMLLNCTRVNTTMIRKIDAQSFVLAVQLAFCSACELVAHYTKNPVVITIEDIQWLSSYEDLLANILKSASLPQPLIVIATARPEYKHNTELFNNVCECYEVSIAPIGPADGRALVDSILPGLDLEADSWHQIMDKAAGIPYYYEEFARMLVRRGYVVERDGKFELVRELATIELPTDIQMLILGKLDQLEPKLKLLVSKASVLGRAFMAKLLIEIESRLVDGEPEKLPEFLIQLVNIEILSRESQNVSLNGFGVSPTLNNLGFEEVSKSVQYSDFDKYFFKHIVTQESAYKAILERNKWLLHSLAAEILDTMIVAGSKTEKELLISIIIHLEFLQRYLDAHKRCCQLLKLFADTGKTNDWEYWEARALSSWIQAHIIQENLPLESPWILEDVVGRKLWRTSQYPDALESFEKALVLHRGLGNRSGEVNTLNSIGLVHKYQGRYELAMAHYLHSLAISRDIYDRSGEGVALNSIGLIHYNQASYAKAMEYYELSLAIKRELGDRLGEGATLNGIGNVHKDQGRYDLAMDYYEQSLAIKREVGDRLGEGMLLHNIGLVHRNQKRFDKAMEYYEQSLAIKREVGDRFGVGNTLNNIGLVHQDLGRYEKALEYYEQSLMIRRDLGDRSGEGNTLESIVQLMITMNNLIKAKMYCLTGKMIANDLNNKELMGYFTADLSLIYSAEGNRELAMQNLQKAKEIAAEMHMNTESEFGQLIIKAEKALETSD